MRTTLKRGIGRGAGLNGKNGHAVFPPTAVSSVSRYRQPPQGWTGIGLLSRILLGTLLTVAGIGLAVAGAAALWFHESVSALKAHSPAVISATKETVAPLPGHAAIALVIGYDQRAGAEFSSVSRSDTVMLVRADPVTNTITLMSIPRDLGVPIYCPTNGATSLGIQKVNQAYADCGPKGTVDTVEHFTGLPVNYVITINFRGFQQIVDKLGGIWLDVDRRYYHVNDGSAAEDYSNINIQPGYQLLSGANALAFVRYRHTDDDYHRIARQQEFVRAVKEQLTKTLSVDQLPSLFTILKHNVEIGGKDFGDSAVLSWGRFLLELPGGHFFQDRIEGVTGYSMTSTDPANVTAALYQFTHPDVAVSKAANAAALGTKLKVKKAAAPPRSKTSVLVLNGNGIAGSAAYGSSALAQLGYETVLPPGNLAPNAPTQGYFHTTIYYDKRQKGSQAAAKQLGKLFVAPNIGPLPKDPKLRALDPGAMLIVNLGETFHNQLVAPATTPTVPKPAPANIRYDSSTGLGLVQPYVHRVPFTLENPTVLEASSYPDNQYGDVAARLYWIDRATHSKALRLVFRTGAGEYWGIEETDMPNPPILADRSFQHAIKGREFQLYYDGSNLHMVVLRVHDKSYWVVNTLLDSLSNKTMLAIAQGLKPLAAPKKHK